MTARILLLAAVTALILPASAVQLSDTVSLISDDRSRALLAKEFIFAETGGTVPVSVDSAVSVLREPSFLTRIQAEYARTLPAGKSPEFTVRQSSPTSWYFINAQQERTDIAQVAERMADNDTFELAYYTEGSRFFGFYQALIHVRLTECGDSTGYTVAVYAYPANGFSRFFARHLNLVGRYFRSKTDEISALAVQISTRLCSPEQPNAIAHAGL